MPLRQTLLAPDNAAQNYVAPPLPVASQFGTAPKAWPDTVAYREAIQNPSACISDTALARCVPVLDKRGLPVAYSGRFAIVFQLRDEQTGETWAFRCFTSPDASGERAARYESIARFLAEGEGDNRPFTPFRFLARGVRVGQAWYPAVAMRWASGTPLGRWVEERRNDAGALRNLTNALDDLLATLEARHIAHGDWQHDNILVEDDGGGRVRLTLVDYDGVFTPDLDGFSAPEAGHPNYQHPRRNASHFGIGLDRFAHCSLTTALHALALAPDLWERIGHDGESVLFRRADFADPELSPVFTYVREVAARTSDAVLGTRLADLDAALACEPGDLLVPLPANVRARASADRSRLWWLNAEAERAKPVENTMAGFRFGTSARVDATTPTATAPFKFAARLETVATIADEKQHVSGVVTASCALGFLGFFFWLILPRDDLTQFFLMLYGGLYLLLASLFYLQWPRKKIHDELMTEYGKAKLRCDAATERLARHDARISLAARYALNIGEQSFVHQRLLEAHISGEEPPSWVPGGATTARRLIAAGVHSLADLHDRLVIPNLLEHQRTALLETRRYQEIEARAEYYHLAGQRHALAEQRAAIEAEREVLRGELAQLQKERAAFPDASVRAYAGRLVRWLE